MVEVSTASAAVANALTGVMSSVGESSLRRVAAGADATVHNLIDGVTSPSTRKIVKSRGCQYRNNATPGAHPVLSSQQLQVAKTSFDPRIERIRRDSVALLKRAAQASDNLDREHPFFEDLGAVHLRLTLPVPTSTTLSGFEHQRIGEEPGPPNPRGRETDLESDTASVAESRASGKSNRSNRIPMSALFDSIRHKSETSFTPEQDSTPLNRMPLQRTIAEWHPDDDDEPPDLEEPGSDGELPPDDDEPPDMEESDSDGELAPHIAQVWEQYPCWTQAWTQDIPGVDPTDPFNLRSETPPPPLDPSFAATFPAVVPSENGGDSPTSSDDGDADDAPQEASSFASTPLGMLGNALGARAALEKMIGIERGTEPVSMECNFCNWLNIGKVQGFVDKVLHIANPIGARDLYVLDVVIPTEVLTVCMETADTLIGEDKPARNLHLQKIQRKLRRIVSNRLNQATFNYLETIAHLVICALLLDSGENGKDHCHILKYSGEQTIFKDFFANTHLEDAMEDLNNAKKEAGHPVEGIVFAVPAPEMKGKLNEKVVMYETAAFGEYELTPKKPIVGAVKIGADLMGKQSPNDHKNPLNFICAVYRHFGDSETVVAEGTPYEYVINLDRSERSVLSASHDRVWDDMIDDHGGDFKFVLTCKEQKFDFDFLADGRPNSYPNEKYEQWLEEQMSDERFFTHDNALNELLANTKATMEHMQQLRATAQVKKGEDSMRSRAVITPGVAGSEGLHQARTQPVIKALEALHAILYNHTNLKGLTEETKRIRFAEFLRAVPKGAIVFGTDKSKNDALFREAVWKKCIKYLARMNDIFEEHAWTRAYAFSPNENLTRESFPTGTLDLKYWTLKLTPLLAILLSGIGPTSFFNRLESTVENGATVLEVQGEEAYQKWRIAERRAVASAHPAWSRHPLPHVAETVEWAPLAPHMVTDTSIKCDKLKDEQIDTYHMGIYEGDDQSHAIIPPNNEEWNDLSPKDTVMKYTSALSKATGFIFEAALLADDLDMVGRNSVIEMLSAYIALPFGRAEDYEVAVIVPKVIKAIRKLPHMTISSQHTLEYDEHGEPIGVKRDSNFWCLALTKFYALAIINHESLGVRGLFLAHGDYAYEKLVAIEGKFGAYSCATIYGDRDPEKRLIEEVASTTYKFCGVMREEAHDRLAYVKTERVIRTCVAAWRTDLPHLASMPKDRIAAALLEFDSITLSLEITDSHIEDPMLLWEELEIGCLLEPLAMHATLSHKKVAAMFRSAKLLADAEETVKLARHYASAKATGSAKDSRPDEAAETQHGGKRKGKSKGEGKKGKGKGKGPPDPKDKWKYPKPSWRAGATNDSWWRSAKR